MELTEIFRILKEKFGEISIAEAKKGSLTEEQYRLILERVEEVTFEDGKQLPKQLFLYYSCARYDRFSNLKPFVISPEDKALFDKCLRLLIESGESVENTGVFSIHKIKWDLHDYLNSKVATSYEQLNRDLLKFQEKLNQLNEPKSQEGLQQFKKEQMNCAHLINAACAGKIKTKVLTKLPLSPVMSNTTVTTVWSNRLTKVSFTPKFERPPNTFVNTSNGSLMIPVTASQWQNSSCDVVILFNEIVESNLPTAPLASHPTELLPYTQWPNIFKDVYEILDAVIWQLREKQDILGRWLLLPSDIATIYYQLWADEELIEESISDSPSLLMRLQLESRNINEIDLDISLPLPWYRKCKLIAHSYLQTGETNEALFWLNVGVESLFEKRSKEVCISNGLEFETLSSSKSYWQNAEEIISVQYPQLSNKIKWPEGAPREPSWFVKIKYLGKKVTTVKSKDILNNYKLIQEFRNALFHGSSDERILWTDAKRAFDAFNWIENNF